MLIDSYESPAAQSLLRLGRERHDDGGRAQRLLRTEAAGAAVFIVAAVLLAALATSARHFSLPALAVMMVTYVIARRVQFPVGSAWTAPTQLVFVPMLFILPTPLVPAIVAGCSLLDLWPDAVQGRLTPTRAAARIGDCFYSLGPALVLVLAGDQSVSVSYDSGFTDLGQGDFYNIPIPALIAAVLYVVGSVVLNYTSAGRTVPCRADLAGARLRQCS